MTTDRAVTTHSFCPVDASDMVGPEALWEFDKGWVEREAGIGVTWWSEVRKLSRLKVCSKVASIISITA